MKKFNAITFIILLKENNKVYKRNVKRNRLNHKLEVTFMLIHHKFEILQLSLFYSYLINIKMVFN